MTDKDRTERIANIGKSIAVYKRQSNKSTARNMMVLREQKAVLEVEKELGFLCPERKVRWMYQDY